MKIGLKFPYYTFDIYPEYSKIPFSYQVAKTESSALNKHAQLSSRNIVSIEKIGDNKYRVAIQYSHAEECYSVWEFKKRDCLIKFFTLI